MGQLKTNEVDGWLARTPPPTPIVLVYGPDRGLVTERARVYAEKCGIPLDDPFSVVRLDASDVDKQAGRLVDEANTMPMFAGRRLIWVRNALGQKALADDVKVLCADPPRDTLILIEAGDLKKGVGMRAVVEASAAALALPCYADDAAATDTLIDAQLAKAGMTMAQEARTVLRQHIGGDRIATRSELEKLVLASMGSDAISLSDVRALVGDASALSAEDMVDAIFVGDLAGFDRLFSSQIRAASQTFTVLSAVQRQFQALLALRLAMEREGRSAGAAVAAARPPVFFSRRKLVENALLQWTSNELVEILGRLHRTVHETRRRADLAVALTHKTLTELIFRQRSTARRA